MLQGCSARFRASCTGVRVHVDDIADDVAMARLVPCLLPMSLDYSIGLVVAVILASYLVYALLRPERF